MAQFEVRLSRKLYKRGDRTEARISLKIQMDSPCPCSVGEMTMKLVNLITVVTAHMTRATNMRMIICFMIFLLHLATFQWPNRASGLCQSNLGFLQDSFTSCLIPGVPLSFDSEEQVDLAMNHQAPSPPTLEHRPSPHESRVHLKKLDSGSATNFCLHSARKNAVKSLFSCDVNLVSRTRLKNSTVSSSVSSRPSCI